LLLNRVLPYLNFTKQGTTIDVPSKPLPLSGVKNMSKEKKSNKESKKKPAMTAKEKKAAKRIKNDTKPLLGSE
jgi:hypothetical protein